MSEPIKAMVVDLSHWDPADNYNDVADVNSSCPDYGVYNFANFSPAITTGQPLIFLNATASSSKLVLNARL